MLTQDQIQECLGTLKTKPKVLTPEDKVQILAMVEDGDSFDTIVEVIQEGNDKVKRDHVKQYLRRRLNRLLKDTEEN